LAERVAERVLNGLRSPFAVGGRRITIQATIGLAYSTGAEDSEAMLRLADVAMHAAKRAGKGQVLRYSEEHRGAGVQDLELRAEFRQDLERDQLQLVYQPIVDLATRRTVGLEALLRWDHPSRGLLTPDRFLHLADNAELSGRLAGWVLREAARQARVLIVAGRPLWISVNLSPRQLGHPDLVSAVRGAVDAARIDPRSIVLEITEHGVMQDIEATAEALRRLKEVGIRIAIDDFGTGYSSLSYLAHLPLDILKIDRSFITAINRSEQDRALVQAVTDLAASLGLQVIAEGIEEVGQLGTLRTMPIELGQGYLLSRPLAPEALAGWLDS
ncbi:MAG TPA: GGDEF domain-containing phosphodiesterase, partial [Candidatus Limnocylindria bacterium]